MHDSILNISVCLKFAPIMFNLWNEKAEYMLCGFFVLE